MVDQGLRARAERILRGDFRNDDLTRLFLYARDRCDGRESVQEIGDFVAHHHERTKGIVTRTTRDWFATIKFKIEDGKDGKVRENVDWQNLPPTFPQFLLAMSRQLSHQIIKRDTGISQSDARTLTPLIIRKLLRKNDGSFSITERHSPKEMKLMSSLLFRRFQAIDCSTISRRPLRAMPFLRNLNFQSLKNSSRPSYFSPYP